MKGKLNVVVDSLSRIPYISLMDCNTPFLTPWYIIVHNVNIVLRSWDGAQGQGLAINECFVDR